MHPFKTNTPVLEEKYMAGERRIEKKKRVLRLRHDIQVQTSYSAETMMPARSAYAKQFPALLVALSFLIFSAACRAGTFDALYAFGDSGTDTGNVFDSTGGGVPASPPYHDGRYSNGGNWLDTLAIDLGGLKDTASLSGGTNYAYGGAVTGPGISISATVPTLVQQAAMFTASLHGQAADPNALYVVWGGGNDVRDGGNPSGSMSNAVANISAVITQLANDGAKDFLVMNVPNFGLAPQAIAQGPATQTEWNSLSQSFDSGLAETLPGLESLDGGIKITPVDMYDFLNNIISDPSAYGFTDVTDACYTGQTNGVGGSVCANPNQYLFWDKVHPSAAADVLIGNYAYSQLNRVSVPEPGIFWLMIWGLGGLALVRRRRRA
jgi:phospholipase/lecithinase/hemolysin